MTTYAKGEEEAQAILKGMLAENAVLAAERVPFRCRCGLRHSAIRVTDRTTLRRAALIVPCNQTIIEF